MKVKGNQRDEKPAKLPAQAGSRRWYWKKRIEHVVLWILPVLPVGYTLSGQTPGKGDSMGWQSLTLMLLPVLGSAVALGFVSRALWRIEINVTGNREHPFTERDATVLSRSGWIMLYSLIFTIGSSGVLTTTMELTDAQERLLDAAVSVATVTALVAASLTSTMQRIHRKAKHAYEELEKGV